MTDENGSGLTSWTPAAAAVIGVFASLAALSASGGGGDRLLRNHPVPGLIAILCLVLALALTVGATLHLQLKRADLTRKFLICSGLIFIAGMVSASFAAFLTSGDHSQPTVSVDFKRDGSSLSAQLEVRDTGLGATDHVKVRVYLFQSEPIDQKPAVYASDNGADSAGAVDVKATIPLTNHVEPRMQVVAYIGETEPDCNTALATKPGHKPVNLSCVIVSLPSPTTSPQVVITLDGDIKSRVVSTHVHEEGVTSDKVVVVSLFAAANPANVSSVIARNELRADSNGTVDATFRAVLPAGTLNVCAVAKAAFAASTPLSLACPVQSDGDTSSSMLIGPFA